MSIELSQEQQQALDAHPANPVHVVDPRTQQAYVLLRADLYERLKELLEDTEDQALQKAWLERATKTRRQWVQENPY